MAVEAAPGKMQGSERSKTMKLLGRAVKELPGWKSERMDGKGRFSSWRRQGVG